MKTTILGGGIIGLALGREMAAHRSPVVIVDPGPPGAEASWAAGGMLCPGTEQHVDKHFRALQVAGRDLYPEYVKALEKETGKRVGFRTEGTLAVSPAGSVKEALREPEMIWQPVQFFPHDYSVDNRLLSAALVESCKKRGVEFVRGAAARVEQGAAVLEDGRRIEGDAIVNAAGCWAAQIAARGVHLDVRPVKGHMAAVRAVGWKLRYTVRGGHTYLIPRNDGRIVIGATMEEAGYDKSVSPAVIRELVESAAKLVPKIRNAPVVETWTGLRPATRTGLPLIGPTKIPGYYVAVGHFRDGILLAPLTAKLLGEVIRGGKPGELLKPFVP